MSEVKKFLPLLLVITGALNVLIIKWADSTMSIGADGIPRYFQHPFLQTGFMFFGQIIAFVVFKLVWIVLTRRRDGSEETNLITEGQRDFSPTLFILPAFCDVVATSMLFMGLYLTYVSSFQMLRGIVLIFVGLYSVSYLNQTLTTYHWLGIFTITLGTILVCLSDYYNNLSKDPKGILTGDLLIICSQIFHAIKYVYEEKNIKTMNIPALQTVGWQGIFGFIIVVVIIIPLNFIGAETPFDQSSRGVVDDLTDAYSQLTSSFPLILAHIIFIISSAIYSYSGMSVMKDNSSSNRVIIDSVRVVLIWLVAFVVEWEVLDFLAVTAFLVLLSGVFIYRNVFFVPTYRWVFGRLSRRSYGDLNVEAEVSNTPADVI